MATEEAFMVAKIPGATAKVALERCRPVLRFASYQDNMVNAIVVSCYLQGFEDCLDVFEPSKDR